MPKKVPLTAHLLRALVVDDLVENRNSFQTRLEALGLTVYLAEDGPEGLVILANADHPIDVIFLDYNMPRMTGFEFIDHLNKKENTAKIPVIMMSTIVSINEIAVAQKGAADWIHKNATTEEIKQCLQNLGA